MHYLKAYVRLVRRAETRIVEDGQNLYEKHHVFPVSLFGKNSRIVLFTLREHYLAHKLLWKACRKRYGYADQKTRKMANAFHWMVYGVGDTNREKTKTPICTPWLESLVRKLKEENRDRICAVRVTSELTNRPSETA